MTPVCWLMVLDGMPSGVPEGGSNASRKRLEQLLEAALPPRRLSAEHRRVAASALTPPYKLHYCPKSERDMRWNRRRWERLYAKQTCRMRYSTTADGTGDITPGVCDQTWRPTGSLQTGNRADIPNTSHRLLRSKINR